MSMRGCDVNERVDEIGQTLAHPGERGREREMSGEDVRRRAEVDVGVREPISLFLI